MSSSSERSFCPEYGVATLRSSVITWSGNSFLASARALSSSKICCSVFKLRPSCSFIRNAVRHVAGGNMVTRRFAVDMLVIEKDICTEGFQELTLGLAAQE